MKRPYVEPDPARRQVVSALLAAAALPAAAQGSGAAPIRLVVPFAPGGPADTLARVLAPRLGVALGQGLFVDNRPGAGGALGAEAVARSAPDGQTLLLSTSSTHSIAPALGMRLPHDPEADFSPVAALADAPGVVLVPAASPARTLREFIAFARQRPGRLNYGSSGVGTVVHLATEYFKAESGTFIVHIPYRGTAPALADLMAGTLDLLFDSLVTGLPAAREGRVRALAVTSLHRSPLAPALPTVADDLPGYEAVTWFGLHGARGMAAATIARLNAAAHAALAEPEVRERLASLGAEPRGGTPAAFAARVRSETEKWRRIARQRGIRAE